MRDLWRGAKLGEPTAGFSQPAEERRRIGPAWRMCMKRLAVLPVLLLAAFCASHAPSPQPAIGGHGAITIEIVPNPIVATAAGNGEYLFPFEVIVRETGGHAVTVNRVTADVTALGALHVGSESYDAAKIAALGYPTSVPANGVVRYRFSPRRAVPDERLFGNVAADLRVDAADDTGYPVVARTNVTVRR